MKGMGLGMVGTGGERRDYINPGWEVRREGGKQVAFIKRIW
jgi:hypothetical protein